MPDLRVRPDDVLPSLVTADPAQPRLTFYEDRTGERIELSARVLATWVAKAGNLLQEEGDVGPGVPVRLDLPVHWRLAVWAYAVWTVGGMVELGDGPAEVVVTDDAERAAAAPLGVLVTLPALARRAPGPVPPGVVDEAAELAGYPDRLAPWAVAAADDPALARDGAATAYGEMRVERVDDGSRVHVVADGSGDPRAFLELTLAAWAAGGSVVLTVGSPTPEERERRGVTERVTLDAPPLGQWPRS